MHLSINLSSFKPYFEIFLIKTSQPNHIEDMLYIELTYCRLEPRNKQNKSRNLQLRPIVNLDFPYNHFGFRNYPIYKTKMQIIY